MFEELGQAVEELEIPVCGDAIAEVIGLADRLEAKICEAVGAFDAAGLWEAEGATSATAWLAHRGRLGGRAAAAIVRNGPSSCAPTAPWR